MKVSIILASILIIASSTQASAQAKELTEEGFQQYLVELKRIAIEKGFEPSFVEQSFASAKFRKRAVKKDRNQPERVETLDTYLPKRVPQWKIDRARAKYKEHYPMLERIGKQYGVQPRFIVALWGLETNFGKIMGNYNVVSALSTLAYEGRREAFFQKQLWAALTIVQEGHISAENMKGSWAGAMGQNQFMPTSFLAYAVDGDGDGKKDIWHNQEDVFASMANYLVKAGWNDELTWGRQVKLPQNFDLALAIPEKHGGRKKWQQHWKRLEKPLSEWQTLGVRRADGSDLPATDLKAALIFPDDENGRVYLAYDNYKSLMNWNFSYYFVTSVGYLSDRIKYPAIEL